MNSLRPYGTYGNMLGTEELKNSILTPPSPKAKNQICFAAYFESFLANQIYRVLILSWNFEKSMIAKI
jgi:hypothetical protein